MNLGWKYGYRYVEEEGEEVSYAKSTWRTMSMETWREPMGTLIMSHEGGRGQAQLSITDDTKDTNSCLDILHFGNSGCEPSAAGGLRPCNHASREAPMMVATS